MKTETNSERFALLLAAAKVGDDKGLNIFFKELYEKGKVGLVRLAGSTVDAEEHFQAAVQKFWENCVIGAKPLPAKNIEGYIFSIARFNCIDQHRKNRKQSHFPSGDRAIESNPNLVTHMQTNLELEEETAFQNHKKTAMHRAIQKLSDNCQRLYRAILEDGVEKAKDLQQVLGMKEVRRVSVLKYECEKRLKILAARELKVLLSNA